MLLGQDDLGVTGLGSLHSGYGRPLPRGAGQRCRDRGVVLTDATYEMHPDHECVVVVLSMAVAETLVSSESTTDSFDPGYANG